jgi:predicted membrane channel-forming protein YqfA (hemolysin III family)
MGMLWMVRLASLAHRWVLGTCSPAALASYTWMEVVCSSGAAINVWRLPERWIHKLQPTEKPIRTAQPLDYFGNSHNIMHVLSVAAMWFIYHGVASESEFMLQNSCPM